MNNENKCNNFKKISALCKKLIEELQDLDGDIHATCLITFSNKFMIATNDTPERVIEPLMEAVSSLPIEVIAAHAMNELTKMEAVTATKH